MNITLPANTGATGEFVWSSKLAHRYSAAHRRRQCTVLGLLMELNLVVANTWKYRGELLMNQDSLRAAATWHGARRKGLPVTPKAQLDYMAGPAGWNLRAYVLRNAAWAFSDHRPVVMMMSAVAAEDQEVTLIRFSPMVNYTGATPETKEKEEWFQRIVLNASALPCSFPCMGESTETSQSLKVGKRVRWD